VLTIPVGPADSPLALAWRLTGVFWSQTLSTLGRHPLAIFGCAAIPAAERWYVLLHGKRLSRGPLAAMELVVTLFRVLLCAVAVWAACSGREIRVLTARVGAVAAWQVALDNLGAHSAHEIRAILWELLFLVVALLLAERMVRWLVPALSRKVKWLEDKRHQKAVLNVWRNLILLPFVLTYLVEMARPGLR
jgi:hypothetical protein